MNSDNIPDGPHTALVIGAGIGGMTAAAALARDGWKITIIEKNTKPGGKMGRDEFAGCTFDTGPSLITMPFVFKEFFASCGRSFEDYVTLRRIEPTCRYFWRDSTRFDAFSLDGNLLKEVEKVFPDDAENVEKYLAEAEQSYEGTKDIFLFNPFDGFKEILKPRNLKLLPYLRYLRPHKTLHSLHTSFFKNPKLIQLFDRFATYNGSSPFKAPAALSIISHVELELGAWYPDGGIYSIARAFETLCRELGVTFRFKSEVHSIITEGKKAKGIKLSNGEVLKADAVISNGDVYWTEKYLLNNQDVKIPELSLAGFVVLAAVKKKDRGLSHHNILFSDNYRQEFEDIFKKQIPADDMTVYISNSSYSDSSMAEPDRENWFMLINAPAGETDFWKENSEAYFKKVLQKMKSFGIDIEQDIIEYRIQTPNDFKNRYFAFGGSIYGAASNNPMSAFLRPGNVSSTVKNLFYVGGSTHPGGGVPLVVLSGDIVSKIIKRDFKK